MKISTKPDLSKVLSWERLSTSEFEETEDRECVEDYCARATSYLEAYDWCLGIRETFVGMFYSKILAIFLFKIQPGKDVGEWVWVIVGDLPPAILPLVAGHNPGMALDGLFGRNEPMG